VASGAVPPRPGIARLVAAALDAGWLVAVASTSAQASVQATLERAVGPDLARAVRVFAGDIVPRKKPAPDIYALALRELGVAAGEAVVVEDSRNGLLAATGAGIACLITVNDFTAGEDFSEAALVVSSLGDPGEPPIAVLANRGRATPGEMITLADLARMKGAPMSTADLADVEAVVHTMAEVAVANEKYFGDLDAVVGDGDFGYSMARGFELVLSGWADFDRADIGTFLKKVAITITSRIGGTSGPIWGTAFLRAGAKAGTATELTTDQVIEMLRASIEGIKTRGKSDVGDKTLLDALVPAVDTIEERALGGESAVAVFKAAALVAREQGRRFALRAACSPSAAGPPTPASGPSAPSTRVPLRSPSCSRRSPTSGRSVRLPGRPTPGNNREP
jgi:HAD superfamily hydrolase (TIGR01509 family)